MQRTDNYIQMAKASNRFSLKIKRAMPVLSLVVIAMVFWSLKLTGITLAGEAFCGKTEHVHGEDCGQPILVCTLEETEGHAHIEECIQRELICEAEEVTGHAHQDSCYNKICVCEEEETEPHTHTEECKTITVICTDEEHEHTEECQLEEVICSLEETEGHIHAEECFASEVQYICGLEIIEPHAHDESCYSPAEECQLEEHIHTPDCYSDITADLETPQQWEETLAGIVTNARPQDNILAIARSQLGYTESQKNFEVDENGQKKGYNRYGQWYGNPYGEWNTMFVSFCLHYAQLQGIPLSAGAETMRIEWEDVGIFIPVEETEPWEGDLIFLDKNANGTADAVAIVTAVTDGQISVIEGDLDGAVGETTYTVDDPAILGYGVIPDMSGVTTLEERALSFVGQTYNYTGQNLNNNTFILYTQSGGNYYAIDNNANAVPIYIDNAGNITADVTDRNTIYWRFESANAYENNPAYYIRNVATDNVYIHPYNNNSANGAAILAERWEAALYRSNNGTRIRGARQNAYAQLWGNATFNQTSDFNSGSVMYFGSIPQACTIWLDGTNGGLRTYGGTLDSRYTFYQGETFNLPTEWQSPAKYDYKIRGWYDVTNSKYYLPGEAVTVTGNMVFYADWVAATYDIGVYDRHTVNTESKEGVITTRVFDYNSLINVMSANPTVDVSANSHKETWSVVQSGNVNYNNQPTQNFVFIDQDDAGELQAPNNRGANSTYAETVTTGIYSKELADTLFSTDNCYDPETGQGVLGKTYLGLGDYLFQYGTDPSSEYYGYYYYDAKLNAASYNQSAQRFYVYDYLEATVDTLNSTTGSHSDFIPLNSVYANTNGKNVATYTYEGEHGEYEGTTHYRFDSAYSDDNNSTNNVITNYSFGMAMDVKFYLPGSPGSLADDGSYKNSDIFGKEMIFRFSGDDDVWVLVDGELVMDIGGIHQVKSGEINFATGEVTVEGTIQHTIKDLEPGEHTLTLYYLDRGGSMSNCAMYYSIAPRYDLIIQKEDVLTQQLLNGAQFAVYTDKECTQLAELWLSEESYEADDPAEKLFTVTNGKIDMWGLVAGSTYYIKEVTPPSESGYGAAKGVIRFAIDKKGIATYDVEILEETDENGNKIPISHGYTVHGVQIDEGTQKAYLVVTNAQTWVKATTTVQVVKIWNDDVDHSDDYITAYLKVTDPNGTVRRIREVTLSEENGWTHIWTGLPKYAEDGVTPIEYGIDEAYEEGYYSSSMEADKIEIDRSKWVEAVGLVNGGKYLFKTNNGYLSTLDYNNSTVFKWVDEATAKASPLAQWNVLINDSNQVNLTNDAGQTITYSGQFAAQTGDNSSSQTFMAEETSTGYKFYYVQTNYWSQKTNYYMGYINNSYNGAGTMTAQNSSNNGLIFDPYIWITQEEVIEIKDLGFKITNTPLEEETSLTVTKNWIVNNGSPALYQQELVTVKLLANGEDTGRTVTLLLRNNWTDTFRGLPYKDESGNVIVYSVEEVWKKFPWTVAYGDIVTIEGTIPTYSTTITNTYLSPGLALPSTGSFARLGYIYCGGGIMLASLITAIRLRRKRERRKT